MKSEGGRESADGVGDVLFVPPVDESDILREPGSAEAAENVSFVPPVDESTISQQLLGVIHQKASPEDRAEREASEEEGAAPAPSPEEIRAGIEAILYAAGEPVTIRELKKVFSDTDAETIKKGLAELLAIYDAEGRGLQIVQVAGGYQITTRPEYHDRVSSIFKFRPPSRLSIQALETLAAIAYRQPVTVPEIMELRGVNSAGVVRTLLEKKLIRILGRKNVVGRPLLYGTTKEFLTRFGLKDMNELPRLEDMAELFGEDISLQLEEALGEKEPSATTAGTSPESMEGGGPSEAKAPSANPEDVGSSGATTVDGSESKEGDGNETEEPE